MGLESGDTVRVVQSFAMSISIFAELLILIL